MNSFAKKLLVSVVVMSMLLPMSPTMALNIFGAHDAINDQIPLVEGSQMDISDRINAPRATYPSEVNTTTLADSTSLNTQRNVVRDDNGRIHTVYPSGGEIWYSTSTNNGQTWNTALNISNDTTWDSVQPAIATNGSTVYVVWADITTAVGDNEDIHFRSTTDNGTTWTPPLDQEATRIYRWTPRPYNPSIAAEYNSTNVYVVWMSNENNGEGRPEDVVWIRRSPNSGSNWNGQLAVSNRNVMAERGTVEVDGAVVAVSWHGGSSQWGASDNEIWWRISNNRIGGWLAGPNRFTFNFNEDINPTIALDSPNITIAFQYWNGNNWDLAYRNSSNLGGRWYPDPNNDPEYLDQVNSNSYAPTLANVGSETYLMWVSEASNANGDLMFTMRNTTTNWTTFTQMTNDRTGSRWPSLNPDPQNGRVEWVWTNGTGGSYSVLYDYTMVTGKPTLKWTGEVGYTAEAVEPDSGTTGHIYRFRVNYTDAENDAPDTGYPTIWLDKNMDGVLAPSEEFALSEDNAADTTYTDGKIYTYTTTFNMVGLSRYAFSAWDTSRAKAVGSATTITNGPNITSVNAPPRLDWLETPEYETDGASPDSGPPITDFVFMIEYLDPLDEAPAASFPMIYIDLNEDGDFNDANENYTMTELLSSDVSFDNGKIYTFNMSFAPGTYLYMFYTEDPVGLNASTQTRTIDVQASGAKPVLGVTGEPGYDINGVEPDVGSDTTEYVFRVMFTDDDGDMPEVGNPVVGIDINADGSYSQAELFAMDEDDTLDTNTKDGKIYTYGYTFGQGALGDYNHTFRARDTNGSKAVDLSFSGPSVTSINNAPILTWVGSVGYSNDGIEPETGFANRTVFNFQVIYSDENDDPPASGYPMIWIDMNLDGNVNISEWFTMNDPDTNATDYVNGKRFTYDTMLSLPGTFTYKFKAKDSIDSLATGSPTGDQSGPVVEPAPNLAPKLELLGVGDYNGSGVSPSIGDLITDFVYKVKYMDLEGDIPGTDWPRLYIDVEGDGDYTGANDIVAPMMENDTGDTTVDDGKVYMYTTTLPMEGSTYQYKFKAEDGNGVAAIATGSINDKIFDGPEVYVNKEPSLVYSGSVGFKNDGVDPDSEVEGSTFTFRVVYKDVEGDAPLDGKVYLRIDVDGNGMIDDKDLKVAMNPVDNGTPNFTLGSEYTVDHTFNDPGTYGYSFEATDIFGNQAGGQADAYMPGPEVTAIIANRDPTLGFTGEFKYVNDALDPLSGSVGTKFTFKVRYVDLDNDAPKGAPTLTVGDQTYTMTAVDGSDNNYVDGKLYSAEVILDKANTYSHSFDVENVMNQSATLGPLDGPFVIKKSAGGDQPATEQMLSDFLWIIILVIVAIITSVIGYAGGKRRKPQPHQEPEVRRWDVGPQEEASPGSTAQPSVATTEPVAGIAAEPTTEPEPMPETPPPSEEVAPEIEPRADTAETTDAGVVDQTAGAEQEAETIEEAKAPEEEAPAESAEEHKTDLSDKQEETEAPVDENEPDTDQQEEKVDEEIDSILSKLEED